ncbi:hypothetical protein OC846_006103 [Tilletia horrida]|uniref:Uncharacterized protein n=1 Tax=Tilletia horrida TaxID=155126 RepID=A0AAN6GK32_9BASI|nr:hypothetical protein OC846_006103 [Tilletia horrida]KAK0561244.1 hypothetical protein OC861_005911 [Tilletia horrida]
MFTHSLRLALVASPSRLSATLRRGWQTYDEATEKALAFYRPTGRAWHREDRFSTNDRERVLFDVRSGLSEE